MFNLFFIAAIAATATAAPAPRNSSELAVSLSNLRETCVVLAKDLRGKEETESYKRRLDRDLASQRVRNDVQLYSIGHGRSQTSQYMLDRMKSQADDERLISDKAIETSNARDQEVEACRTGALAKGKDAFAGFKKAKRPRADADAATDIMASWMVNVETISLSSPVGTDASEADWKKARSRAELQEL